MRVRESTGLAMVLLVLVALAQNPGDEWKSAGAISVQQSLASSLENAPLTRDERAEIYRVVDNPAIHGSFYPFNAENREKEQRTVMSSRVGFIQLAEGAPRQILVQGPLESCGANGNCSYWIFSRQHNHLRLLLHAAGDLTLRHATSRGYRDVSTSWHMSAFEHFVNIYHWDGSKYESAKCFDVKADGDNSEKQQVVGGCPLNLR